MAKHVTVVQPRHSNLRDNHLQESGERREDTELLGVETEPGGGTKVATLHDAGRDEDLGVLLVDHLQSRRALEVA